MSQLGVNSDRKVPHILLASRKLAGLITRVSSLASPAKFEARRYNDFSTDEGALSRPFPPRNSSPASFIRINGKIRAREVRVIGFDGKQLGVMLLNDAINLARQASVDLVEIAANAVPPVCRVVDFGKYRYEMAKKEKESKKHQHTSTVKEIQLSPRIDPHDLSVKVGHAIDFLCEDMKVKVTLRFRGREMQHTEFGFEVVKKFVALLETYGHPDFPPKMIGRGINMMMSPLPRNKRAKNPRTAEDRVAEVKNSDESTEDDEEHNHAPAKPAKVSRKVVPPAAESEVSENVPPPILER